MSLSGRNRDLVEHNTFVNLRPRPNAAWTNEAAVTVSSGAEPVLERNVFSQYEHGVSQPRGKVPGAALKGNLFETKGSPLVRWLATANADSQYEDVPLPSGNQAMPIRFVDPDRDDFRLAAEQVFADRDVGARKPTPPQPTWPEIAEERDLRERMTAH